MLSNIRPLLPDSSGNAVNSFPVEYHDDIDSEEAGLLRVDSKTPINRVHRDRRDLNDDSQDKVPNEDAQDGVKQVEAITLVWTKNSLILAYAL